MFPPSGVYDGAEICHGGSLWKICRLDDVIYGIDMPRLPGDVDKDNMEI